MNDWIARLFENKELLRMGHCQRPEDLNLGMGWLYYGLTRLIRPKQIVVIGSWRGFTPLTFGKAMADNSEGGEVHFIDPSMVDDFWKEPAAVQSHFASFGVNNIRHYLMTTQQFTESEPYQALDEVGIVFIDGLHTEEQARFDYEAFRHKIAANGMFLFHDSIDLSRTGGLYPPELAYERSVRNFIDTLKASNEMQVFDFPFAKGLTLAQRDPLN
jgi:predicted O-methyltransferase YrrM